MVKRGETIRKQPSDAMSVPGRCDKAPHVRLRGKEYLLVEQYDIGADEAEINVYPVKAGLSKVNSCRSS